MACRPRVYDRTVQLEMPGGVTGHGWGAADGFWLRLRAAFPDAVFRIDHVIGREDAGQPPRAALESAWPQCRLRRLRSADGCDRLRARHELRRVWFVRPQA